MKFLFDLFPVILFFIAFKFADIFVATGVAIAATIAQIGYTLARGRKVSGMQWTGLGVIVIFGGATLILRDETFIKWKPTVLYWTAGAAFLIGLAMKKNLVKSVLGEELVLPEPVWFKLCIAWGLFFLFKGALNLFVAYNFSTETWVTFKVFGGFGLMFLFMIAQGLWIMKYLPDEPAKDPPKA